MVPVHPLSRRRLLKLGAGSLLTAGLWPGALAAADAEASPLCLVIINDLHYTDKGCGPYFEKLVAQIKRTPGHIDGVLLVGDLSDNGKPDQLASLADILKTLGAPVHAVIGNHDWRTMADRKPWEDVWPKSINYIIERKGWQIVGLDSSDGTKWQCSVQKHTLDFLDEQLPKLDRKRPTIVFTHMPLGPKVSMRLGNADDVLGRFKEHNLRAVYCGHHHAFTERQVNGVVVATNRCCALRRNNHDRTTEKGYFVCTARDGAMAREFVEFKP